MGTSPSKPEKKTEPLSICKLRRTQVKSAIESRYYLAASHLTYTTSLRNIGISLRRFAESEILTESSLSHTTSTTNVKTPSPSHSSLPSPSPSHLVSDSPSPLCSTPVSNVSYMKTASAAVTVKIDPRCCVVESGVVFGDDESVAVGFSLPPPPPPPPGMVDGGLSSSWDYFGPVPDDDDDVDVTQGFSFVGDENDGDGASTTTIWGKTGSFDNMKQKSDRFQQIPPQTSTNCYGNSNVSISDGMNQCETEVRTGVGGVRGNSKKKDVADEREDPSEYITHRAKDFLSSIKDIENRFFRAGESGKEVSRMLEVNRIRGVGYAEVKGKSSDQGLSAFGLVCCRGKSVHASYDLESSQHVNKIITWKRSLSSQSSSSRHPLTAGSAKSDADDSGSDLVEEFCMISGSHLSSLDRLYAWEQKLYDEVKASESIRKVYDRTCNQLGQQFAKNVKSKVIDKTRATVKDLHSRIRVSLHSVDAIAKRIEKMRDEELQPQLLELIQGFIRMWKAMLECHHAQYITISLAYHAKPLTHKPNPDTRHQILIQLIYEFECFGLSFDNWMRSHTSYIESLNGWLQSSIIQPKERSGKSTRRPLSPSRVLAPPIFVLCRDWVVGIKSLPADEVSDSIRALLCDLHELMKEEMEDGKSESSSGDQVKQKCQEGSDDKIPAAAYTLPSNLHCVHSSLTKLLDRLTKFSEAALKLYEDVKHKNELAHAAYVKGGSRPAASNVYYQ